MCSGARGQRQQQRQVWAAEEASLRRPVPASLLRAGGRCQPRRTAVARTPRTISQTGCFGDGSSAHGAIFVSVRKVRVPAARSDIPPAVWGSLKLKWVSTPLYAHQPQVGRWSEEKISGTEKAEKAWFFFPSLLLYTSRHRCAAQRRGSRPPFPPLCYRLPSTMHLCRHRAQCSSIR